jgi:DNA-binding NarL/FixJ family response regulator
VPPVVAVLMAREDNGVNGGANWFVPVVMLASSIRAEDVYMAYSLGANGFLDKMSHGAPWHEMVQTAVRYWLRMNVAPNSLVGQEEGFVRRT